MLGKRGEKPDKTKSVGTEQSDAPSHTTYKIDHAISSTAESLGKWRRLSFRKKILMIMIVLLIVGIGVAGGYSYYRNRNTSESVRGPKCSEQQLRKAAAEIDPSRSEYLKPTFDEIINTTGYEQDPNCMYVVVNYYINISDAAHASSALNQLEKVYNPQAGYDEGLGQDAKSPADLKLAVDFLNEQAERYKDIDFSTGAPPQ